MNKESDIYKMKLHDIMITSEHSYSCVYFTTVMRVPGGWIYRMVDKNTAIFSAVFVRFDNEFQVPYAPVSETQENI